MNDKRRDNKGRILNTGENQRKDGSYQYRYIDYSNKRQYIYAPKKRKFKSSWTMELIIAPEKLK